MKNILRVIVAVLMVVITFTITYSFIVPYSQRDVQRILDIDLGKKKANVFDYCRLDVNRDNEIDLFDGVLILRKIGK